MKKAVSVIKNIFVWLVVLLAVFMMIFTIISVTTFNRNDRNLFGYKAYIVMSDSMSATDFNADDLIFVKEVAPSSLKEGDIISYLSQNSENFGETVTHKIRKKTVDSEGNPGFITYGTTTNKDDETVVTYRYVVGKYTGKIQNLGTFFNFVKTPKGYMLFIFLPFILLILYHGINCARLFKRHKKEQMDAIQSEKDKIAAEREENAKILAELKSLKAELENKSSQSESDE